LFQARIVYLRLIGRLFFYLSNFFADAVNE